MNHFEMTRVHKVQVKLSNKKASSVQRKREKKRKRTISRKKQNFITDGVEKIFLFLEAQVIQSLKSRVEVT